MSNIICVGLGEILWDILPSGPRLGGAPSNFTFHASNAQLDACVVSALGYDKEGDEALAILERNQVKTLVARNEYITGYVKASIDDKGVAHYDFATDTAYDHLIFTDKLLHLAQQTKLCCFGSLAQRQAESRHTIMAFLDAMPQDAFKVFDINLRQNFFSADIVINSLKRANVLKCNEDELPIICQLLNIEAMGAAEFFAYLQAHFNLHTLIYTQGEHGSDIFYHNEHSFLPTPQVKVVDTVGAGDSFTATFMALIVQGVELKLAHQMAVEVSAFVCTQNGAMPVLPSELKAKMLALLA